MSVTDFEMHQKMNRGMDAQSMDRLCGKASKILNGKISMISVQAFTVSFFFTFSMGLKFFIIKSWRKKTIRKECNNHEDRIFMMNSLSQMNIGREQKKM